MTAQDEEELPPSKLGTKDHWDSVYERENAVFDDVQDEGEVWFGESSVTKMRKWATQHLPPSSSPIRVLECGSGNGTLLLSFLTSPTDSGAQAFRLTGIDYSAGSTRLSQSIEAHRREHLEEEIDEEEEVINPVEVDWRTGDLLRDDVDEQWDLVLDKGTFDALCLSQEVVEERGGRLPSVVYPEQVAKLVKDGGYFLITSCNFTEEEIRRRWTKEGLGFEYHSSVPHKSYTFGGRSGTIVCTVAFKKLPSANTAARTTGTPTPITADSRGSGQEAADDLYLCIDCGGTKTDVAIASSASQIVARALGGTGNMAEVGLAACCRVILSTVNDAIRTLRCQHNPDQSVGAPETELCAVRFKDVWVGISGCDTPLDQSRMSALLSPFFQLPSLPILNDAHLLGGPLLRRHAPWGIAVIAGTGSVVVGLEVQDGQVVQVGRRGGLGYLLGDDGSAFDLGRSAIRLAVDAFDQGVEAKGGLARDMREHFDVSQTPEVLAKVYDLDPALSPIDATNTRKLQISSLARPILAAYAQTPPDSLAVEAVRDAAGRLATSINSLARQLTFASPGKTKTQARRVGDAGLILGGGVLQQDVYRDVLIDLLREQGVEFGWVETVQDVAGQGALGLAERARAE